MMDQDIFSLWPQFRTELLVFLGRPSIQLQLAVVAFALVAAAVLGRTAINWWHARYASGIEEAAFGRRFIYHLLSQIVPGVLTLVIIEFAKSILALQGTRTALIDSLLSIVAFYVVLKILVAFAFAVGDSAAIERYRRILIIPLLISIISVQLLNVFFSSGRLINAPIFTLFDNTVTLSALFLITAGFYLWIVGVYAFGQGTHYLATNYGGADSGSTQATLTLLRYILIIIGLVYVLFNLNFNTTTIAAISGGLSVGIGFALSTILSNFVSGILLLFERTLQPGDIIEINGELSTVEMITIRSIRVRTFNNVEKIIPNSDFVTSSFTTYTGKSKHVRLKLPVSASYRNDHRHVINTLLEIANAYPRIMQDPPPEVRLEKFGDYSIDYQLYVWIETPLLGGIVKHELHQAILDAFTERDITIPFPYLEVEQIKST